MANIAVSELVPHSTTMKLKHPVTGETAFTVGNGKKQKKVEGILTVVGHFSNEFHKAIMVYLDNDRVEGSVLDHLDEQTVKLTAACVTGWKDNGFFDEPYSPEGIEEIMMNPEFRFITNQVREFVAEKQHFFG